MVYIFNNEHIDHIEDFSRCTARSCVEIAVVHNEEDNFTTYAEASIVILPFTYTEAKGETTLDNGRRAIAMIPKTNKFTPILVKDGFAFVAPSCETFEDFTSRYATKKDLYYISMDTLVANLKEFGINDDCIDFIRSTIISSNGIKAQLDNTKPFTEYVDSAKEVLPVSVPSEIDAMVEASVRRTLEKMTGENKSDDITLTPHVRLL